MNAILRRYPMQVASFAHIVADLVAGKQTADDLCHSTGLHINTVRKMIAALHRREVVHIADWEMDDRGAMSVPAYVFGKGKDKPRPPRKSKAQVQRDHRARIAAGTVRTYRRAPVASVFHLAPQP